MLPLPHFTTKLASMRADQARTIPIDVYLERRGLSPTKTRLGGRELWYHSPIREGDETPSFKVDTGKNVWFDHGLVRGGNRFAGDPDRVWTIPTFPRHALEYDNGDRAARGTLR